LLVAKAPVIGEVKTRLGWELGESPWVEGGVAEGLAVAARLAAAALWDTVEACEVAFGPGECHLALAGDLSAAVDGDRLADRFSAWTVHPQRGTDLGERLSHAHHDAAAHTRPHLRHGPGGLGRPDQAGEHTQPGLLRHLEGQFSPLRGANFATSAGSGPVVQVGMDTPQITPDLLRRVAAEAGTGRAVLGPAEDGGWWVLALGSPGATAALVDVPMSRPDTYQATRAALTAAGADVVTTRTLRDVDTVADAEAVAAAAPDGRFARAWAELTRREPAR